MLHLSEKSHLGKKFSKKQEGFSKNAKKIQNVLNELLRADTGFYPAFQETMDQGMSFEASYTIHMAKP